MHFWCGNWTANLVKDIISNSGNSSCGLFTLSRHDTRQCSVVCLLCFMAAEKVAECVLTINVASEPTSGCCLNKLWNCKPTWQVFPTRPSIFRRRIIAIQHFDTCSLPNRMPPPVIRTNSVSDNRSEAKTTILNNTKRLSYFDYFSKIFPPNIVVSFKEDFTQTAFSDWIIFGVEFIEAMESITILNKGKVHEKSYSFHHSLSYRVNIEHVDS